MFLLKGTMASPQPVLSGLFLEFERIGLHVKQMNSDANARRRRRLSAALDWPPDCWIICKTGSAQAAFVIICRAQVWNLLPVQSKQRDAEVMPGLSRVTVPALRLSRRGCQFTLTGFFTHVPFDCVLAPASRFFFSLSLSLTPPFSIACDFPSLSVTQPACCPLVFKLTIAQLPHGIQKLFQIREK